MQTARWWASRIEPDEHGRGHIRGVIGPDEYHERVDDNAFTNVMARWNLKRAAALGPDAARSPSGADGSNSPTRSLDGYDPATGIYEQFAGFHGLEPILIAQLAPRRPVSADVLLGHERTRTAQVVKQADALMLHYLIPDETAPARWRPTSTSTNPAPPTAARSRPACTPRCSRAPAASPRPCKCSASPLRSTSTTSGT